MSTQKNKNQKAFKTALLSDFKGFFDLARPKGFEPLTF